MNAEAQADAERRLRQRLALFGILLLATLLRIEQPDLLALGGDESTALNQAYDVAHGDLLTIAPFSGSILPHPPAFLYTLAPAFLVGDDLRIAAVYKGLLGVAAVALTWWLARRYFGSGPALWAALLFAVAPWVVLTARKVSIEPLPLYTLVLMAGVLEVRVRRSAWGWAIAGLGLALCLGTHLSYVGLAIVVALLLLPAWRTLRLGPALIGLAPLALLTGTYLAHEATIGFANFARLLGGGAISSEPAIDQWLKLWFPLWLSGGWHISDLTGPAFAAWRSRVPEWTDVVNVFQVLFLIGATVWLVRRVLCAHRSGSSESAPHTVLLAWLVGPILFFGVFPLSAYIHYYLSLYPAPFIVMGLALERVWQTRPWRWAVALGAALVLSWQVVMIQHFLDFVGKRATTPGGYAEPIRSGLTAVEPARRAAATEGLTDIILVSPDTDPAIASTASELRALTLGMRQRYVNPSQSMILRGASSQYLLAPGQEEGLRWLRPYVPEGFVSQITALRDGVDHYIYVRIPGAYVTKTLPEADWALWESGARLIDVEVTRDGAALDVVTFWSITAVPAYGVHWFHHLFAGDQRIAQADIGGVDVGSWRVGDVLLNHVSIEIPADAPAGPYDLRLGSYTYPELRRLSLLDANGLPAHDAWVVRVP